MDELMMDWLYEELDPTRSARFAEHAGGCARCSTELSALRRTREAFREMSDLEPPPALSAILLHEAARRAPSAEAGAVVVAVSPDGDTGLWARIAAWLRPLALHPAATAACTVIFLAGVAGALYVRSGGEMAASPRVSSPDLPPPPDDVPPATAELGGGANPTDEKARSEAQAEGKAEPEADLEKAPAEKRTLLAQDPARDLDGLVTKDAPADPAYRQASGFAAGVLDNESQDNLRAIEGAATAAAARATEESLGENKESSDRREKRKAEATRGHKGDVGDELDEAPGRVSDKSPAKLTKKVAPPRPDDAVPPATAAPLGRAQEPSADPAATSGVVGGTRGPTRSSSPLPKVERAEPSPRTDVDAEPEAAAPPAAGASASAAPAEIRTPAQLAWLSSQEGKIAPLTRSGKCREVAAVANDILDRDPSYYVRRVQGTVLTGKCQRLVGQEQRRRATRRASKNGGGSQRNVKAAAERSEPADAAETETETEKAQKK